MIPKVTIYVVDDEESVRRSVCRLLNSAHYRAQAFASADEFIAFKRETGPACLILDLMLPGVNGLELQKSLAAADSPLPVIFISGQGDIPSSVSAMKAGAIDFLPKPFDDKTLIQAVERALARYALLRREQNERRSVENRRELLTSREDQVFTLVVGGHLNKQIALKLGISEKTVKVHRARVMEKMRAKSLADLVHLKEKIHPSKPSKTPSR